MPKPSKIFRIIHIPSYMHPHLEVKDVGYGKGVFTTNKIAAGTVLTIFNGININQDEAQRITDLNGEESNYIIQVADNIWLHPLQREDADYFNHACTPNSGFSQKSTTANTLVAMRDLESGEEVRYHYAFSDIDIYYEFNCRCGTHDCTGSFSTDIGLQVDFQKKYIDYLAPFLIARIQKTILPKP